MCGCNAMGGDDDGMGGTTNVHTRPAGIGPTNPNQAPTPKKKNGSIDWSKVANTADDISDAAEVVAGIAGQGKGKGKGKPQQPAQKPYSLTDPSTWGVGTWLGAGAATWFVAKRVL